MRDDERRPLTEAAPVSTSPDANDSTGLREYLRATLGDTAGWLTALVGYGGHFVKRDNGDDAYAHRECNPRVYQWPAEVDRAVRELTQMAHLGDVWVCPYVMTYAVRTKGESVSRPHLHADVDHGVDYAKVARFSGAFVVGSGRDGHGHVYVPLTRSVTVQQHRALEEGLREYLGGDDKITDNDLLRPVGTLNHKSDEPSPVEWLIRPTDKRADPDAVASVLGVALPDENATTPVAGPAGVPIAVDLAGYPSVRAALEQITGDRSRDIMRVVGAGKDAGLTLDQARSVVASRPDLSAKLAENSNRDDVLSCWLKVIDDRQNDAWAKQISPSVNGQAVVVEDAAKVEHSGQVRIAYRLAARYADRLLHVHGIGWFWWDGMRWAVDDTGRAQRAVLDVLKRALAASLDDKVLRRDVQRCESAAGIAGVLTVAAALPAFAASVRDLDADPHLLNHASGTLDLRTFQTHPHSPADRLTKVCRGAYRPDAESTTWEAFLTRVLPDADVRAFLQRYVGVGLRGDVVEHKLVIGTGTGANGKSVFDGAIRNALGDYAITAEPDLFMHRDNAHPTGEMDLRGVRLVTVSESERDRRLAEATVKRLTGGDTIRARRMRQDFIEFAPSHTAFLITNHLPRVSGDDAAIWRRLRVVPFDVVIPESEQNGQLGVQLELEADAVLTWTVAGYRDYVGRGLDEPASVLKATDAYQFTSDAVRRFVDDACVTTSGALKATTAQLHVAWEKWRVTDGAEPMSQAAFGQALTRLGYPADPPSNGKRWRPGIAVKAVDDAD